LFALDEKYFNGRDPLKERINNPIDAEFYWRWRMHVSLESLLEDNGFSQKLRGMLKDSGRVGCLI
jgi:4-alpha-glucanotransferase